MVSVLFVLLLHGELDSVERKSVNDNMHLTRVYRIIYCIRIL